MRKYYWAVFARMQLDALHILRTELQMDAILGATAIVATAAFIFAGDSSVSWDSVAILVLSFVAAIGLVFVWSLAWAPVNMEREVRSERDAAYARLERTEKPSPTALERRLETLRAEQFEIHARQGTTRQDGGVLLREYASRLSAGLTPRLVEWTWPGDLTDKELSRLCSRLQVLGFADSQQQAHTWKLSGDTELISTYTLSADGATAIQIIEGGS